MPSLISRVGLTSCAALALSVATAEAQVVPGDDFGVALLALTPNVFDDPDQALIDGFVNFGETVNLTTTLGTPVTISSGQSTAGGVVTTFIEISTTEPSLVPAGTTFTDFNGTITEPADILAFGAGSDISNGILDGLDLQAPIVDGSLEIDAFITVDGTVIGPFPGGTDINTNNPFTSYQTDNGGPEVDGDFFIGTDDGDISDELLSGIRLEISYVPIPEPTALSLVALSGLALRRRR